MFQVLLNGYTREVLPKSAAEWVKDVRKRTGLTQEDFAARLRVGRTTVADWERGASEPEWASIHRILATFPSEAMQRAGKTLRNSSASLEEILQREASSVTLQQAARLRTLVAELDSSGSALTDTGLETLVHALVGRSNPAGEVKLLPLKAGES